MIPTLGLSNYDRAVVKGFGASLMDVTVDDHVRKSYAVSVAGVNSELSDFGVKVPVLFGFPEDPFQDYVLPCYVVKRTELTPNFDGKSWIGQCRVPSVGSNKVHVKTPTGTITGYDSYTSRRRPDPFDIGYDVQVMARYQHEGAAMLKHLLRYYNPPGFGIRVFDSENGSSIFDTIDFSISSMSELSDIGSRMIAWTVSFMIKGEIDSSPDVIESGSLIRGLPEITYVLKVRVV